MGHQVRHLICDFTSVRKDRIGEILKEGKEREGITLGTIDCITRLFKCDWNGN